MSKDGVPSQSLGRAIAASPRSFPAYRQAGSLRAFRSIANPGSRFLCECFVLKAPCRPLLTFANHLLTHCRLLTCTRQSLTCTLLFLTIELRPRFGTLQLTFHILPKSFGTLLFLTIELRPRFRTLQLTSLMLPKSFGTLQLTFHMLFFLSLGCFFIKMSVFNTFRHRKK